MSDTTDTASLPIETDALVIGAGPVGLFLVFELGLLEVHAHVVDSLPYAGGQCAELYPDKPIYDIPAIAKIDGRELAERLLAQAAPLGPVYHFGEEVSQVQQREDGRFDVQTHRGTRFIARTVFIAGGVGSFQRRELKVHGLAEHEGRQVFYRPENPAAFAGQRVFIAGANDNALEWAIALADPARPAHERAAAVTLMHRRDVFQAEPRTIERLQALRDAGLVRFLAGQVQSGEEHDGRLSSLVVSLFEGGEERVPIDALLVLLGVSPKLGPIAQWGAALERKQVVVDTEKFETSVPHLHAVGDIVHYPGKRKLIVSGFHEATMAAYAAAAYLRGQERVLLQYTTTSPRLHELLGVATEEEKQRRHEH